MRIRNRPTPSIYPPPPDLKLNRSSFLSPPPPQPKKQLLPALLKPQPPAERQLRGSDHDPSFSDRTGYTTNFVSAKKSSPDAAAAAAASTDDNDYNDSNNNTTRSWKDESIDDDTGVQLQPFSHTEGTVRKGATSDKRGSRVAVATMEGSRCSRINGRGWRCGQQTIVGYSLCEHHLGKSRLRSLSSVKNVTTSNKLDSNKKNRLVEETDDDDDDDDDDEPLLISNGRKKSRIGTVKARSLSSLLGQTSQTTNGRR